MNQKHLAGIVTIYLLVCIILFPSFRFVLDSDATGYLSVAEKLSRGEYFRSINAIWSPMGSWAVFPFVKAGCDGIIAAKILNIFYGLLCLVFYYSFIKKLQLIFIMELAVMTGGLLLIVHFAQDRLFGDLLQMVFLLAYLNIIFKPNFAQSNRLIIVAAIIGSLSFYAKSYSLYFVLIHLIIIILVSEKRVSGKYLSYSAFRKILLVFFSLFLTVFFWIYCLNAKYGFSIPGRLNISGKLKEYYHPLQIIAFAPPEGDYALFDDISQINNAIITPFTNFDVMIWQLKIIFVNFFVLLEALSLFSLFFIPIIIFYFFFPRAKKAGYSEFNLKFLSFLLLWPSGYLFFTIQDRFLWIEILVGLSLAGVVVNGIIKQNGLKYKNSLLLALIILGSFYIYPIKQIANNYGSGKEIFKVVSVLKKQNVKGNILSSMRSFNDYSKTILINYLLKTRFYGPYIKDYTSDQISEIIKKYQIDYYFFYYERPIQKEDFLNGKLAKGASKIYDTLYPGIVVLKF